MDGTPFLLPDASVTATFAVVSFDDDAGPLASQWMRLGQRLAEHAPGLAVVDVLVVPPRMKLLGDVALYTLRARAERAGAVARTAAVYERRKPFRKALGIDDAVTAFLVGPDGTIAWRGDGEIDLQYIGALEQALAASLPAQPATAERTVDPSEDAEQD